MADFMIEIEFQLGGSYERDVDLLESIGVQLEEIAGETGPSAAIHGQRYSVTLLTEADSFHDAGTKAAAITVEAVNRALGERGDELHEGAFDTLMERMLVEHAEDEELALA